MVLSGQIKYVDVRSRSESESEEGAKSEGADAKLGDLPMVRLKWR